MYNYDFFKGNNICYGTDGKRQTKQTTLIQLGGSLALGEAVGVSLSSLLCDLKFYTFVTF